MDGWMDGGFTFSIVKSNYLLTFISEVFRCEKKVKCEQISVKKTEKFIGSKEIVVFLRQMFLCVFKYRREIWAGWWAWLFSDDHLRLDPPETWCFSQIGVDGRTTERSWSGREKWQLLMKTVKIQQEMMVRKGINPDWRWWFDERQQVTCSEEIRWVCGWIKHTGGALAFKIIKEKVKAV